MINKHKTIFASIYLGLGTNLGNRKQNMETAIENIEKQIGTIIAQSAFYSSEPFGFESDNLFLNSVVKVHTSLLPYELLATTQQIEIEMGRTVKSDTNGYTDRVIDIDILLYNQKVIDNAPHLVLPHPEMQKRDFVLKPLAEIAPHFVHPVLNRTISELVEEL
jgi:2-amino-4-hydroxy-6-hydroxymethyldihydropteridine diphosphokinase